MKEAKGGLFTEELRNLVEGKNAEEFGKGVHIAFDYDIDKGKVGRIEIAHCDEANLIHALADLMQNSTIPFDIWARAMTACKLFVFMGSKEHEGDESDEE